MYHTTGVNCICAEWQHAQSHRIDGFQRLPTTFKTRPLEPPVAYTWVQGRLYVVALGDSFGSGNNRGHTS